MLLLLMLHILYHLTEPIQLQAVEIMNESDGKSRISWLIISFTEANLFSARTL